MIQQDTEATEPVGIEQASRDHEASSSPISAASDLAIPDRIRPNPDGTAPEQPEQLKPPPTPPSELDFDAGSRAVRSQADYPVRSIPLSSILRDYRIQARVQTSRKVVEEYAR